MGHAVVSRSNRSSRLQPLAALAALAALSLVSAGCDCAGTTEVRPDAHVDASFDAAPRDGAADSGIDGGSDGGAHDGGSDGGPPDGGPPDVGPDAFCAGTMCDTECVDVETDPLHCGSCTNDCTGLPHVDGSMVTCSDSECVLIGACEPGFADCNANPADGCETDLSQPETCGACDVTCGEPTPLCGLDASTSERVCVSGCTGGTVRCDGSCVDLTNDATHCGACTNVCVDPGHGTATCTDSSCIPTCDSGYHACGDVCAIDTDVSSCGTSCTPCTTPANATATCDGSACGFECIAPFADCNGNPADGCETDTSNDEDHCNACGAMCSVANGSPQCLSSTCGIGSCNPGFDDCNAIFSDGCETSTVSDPTNCSACGFLCSLPNADAACAGGTCAVASCDPGFMDCDGLAGNGCETNVLVDANACGTCGNVCMTPFATPACVGGTCAIAACTPGRQDCNGNWVDGCEINLVNDAGNCGTCGRVCSAPNATMACASGGCVIASCNAGFADCNGNPTDGCEINLLTNFNNCGTCGRSCTAPNAAGVCSAGTCSIGACNAGFGNCNGAFTDGCEVNLTNTTSSCGTCGNDCGAICTTNVAAVACVASSCRVTGCTGGRYDIDGVCSSGCECATTGVSGTCGSPTDLGVLNVGQVTSFTGNLVPAGQEAWLRVTFVGNTNTAYHPRVRITGGSTTEFRFDVLNNCAGSAMACGTEGGISANLADWEVFYTGGDPTVYPEAGSHFNPIPSVGSSGTVLIHVYRRAGQPVTCNNFTLTLSN